MPTSLIAGAARKRLAFVTVPTIEPVPNTLGPCPSWTRKCDAGLAHAESELPAGWGTGKVLYGVGPAPRYGADGKSGTFSATTIAVCANGHRVAGGHKVRSFHPEGK